MAEKIQSLLNDEESMRQIKELAEMFGMKPDVPQAKETAPDLGFSEIINPASLMQLSAAFSNTDENCRLIEALKPLLSQDKQQRADRAIKMLRLFNVYSFMKENGIF